MAYRPASLLFFLWIVSFIQGYNLPWNCRLTFLARSSLLIMCGKKFKISFH